MFRAVLLAISIGLLLVATFVGCPAIPLAIFGFVLTFGLLFERYIYKPIRPKPPGPEWERTTERFVDPQSGQSVTVYFNPHTGERRYVGDGDC
jgi:hypothetical protein